MTRTRWMLAAAAVLVMTCMGGVVGWVRWSDQAAGDVRVTWSADSPACEGTVVHRARPRRPVIEARRGMRCVIEVRVSNASGLPVSVVEATAPVVGPRTGAVVSAANGEPAGHGAAYGLDARFPLGRSLAAGESTAFPIELVLHPRGCDEDGTLTASHWPTVTVTVLGRTHDVRGDTDLAFHRDGETPGCDT